MNKVLCEGLWMFCNSNLALQNWAPNLPLDESFFVSAPMWTRLPGLPLKFWIEEFFKGIVGSFGELLSIDLITTAKSKLVFARICMNFNKMMDMPQSIEILSKIGKWTQVIEYETLPFVCFHCKKSGHREKSCSLKKSKISKNDRNLK